jgi:hypothetical protein
MTEPYLQELLTVEGFVKRYLDMLADYGTCQETYAAVERQYFNAFGKNKYKDYDSFKVTLSRYQAKKVGSK